MNHNRRKFTPTTMMPRPFARTQTRHEFGKGQTVRYTVRGVPLDDGTTVDMPLRQFKEYRLKLKRMAHKSKTTDNNKENT